MRNKTQIIAEANSRTSKAIKRGFFETKSDIASRLLCMLSKQWIDPAGKIWTLRAYLLKYNRNEYKKILSSLRNYYKGTSFFDRKGDNLDFFQHNFKFDKHVNYEGRPEKLIEFYKMAYPKVAA